MDQVTVSRELLRQALEGIKRSRCTAMIQTLAARIPESGLFGGIAQDLDFAESKLRAALEHPAVEQDAAYREAKYLAEALFKKHYAGDEPYASGAVEWGLCDTTAGIISQIDNMVCRLVRPSDVEKPAVEPYGWHVTGSNELLRGIYAQSDAESDAERCGGTAVALYTAPPPPADVPLLTDDEIYEMYSEPRSDAEMLAFGREVEQAVRQKAWLK